MVLGIFKPVLPHIVQDVPLPAYIPGGGGISLPEYRQRPYYVVLSVDLGNTITDCIIIGTNLETGMTYTIASTSRMTRDIRPPKEGERLFGQTIDGIVISQNAVVEFVRDIIRQCVKESKIDVANDLDFVVYCTGLVATWESSDHLSSYISSLAKGCLEAGIPGSKMTPPMSKKSLRPQLQKYSLIDKVHYRGTIAGVVPVTKIAGNTLIANEMEGDLSMAGMKEGALHSPVDLRNPCISIDFGTILDGRITGNVPDEGKNPHATTIGCYVGLGGSIVDNLARGTGVVDPVYGCAHDLFGDSIETGMFSKNEKGIIKDYVDQIHEYITVSVVPRGVASFGCVPIDEFITENTGITVIGVDCGTNFSTRDTIRMLGGEVYKKHGKKAFAEVVDRICSRIALRLLDVAGERGFIQENSTIGFSGRGVMTGRKPEYILQGISERGFYKNPRDRVVFVTSALPRGASLMARCMASLGRPGKPIGGVRGGKCILGRRILSNT
jgi:putative methanogenesis marker protein 14